MLDLSQVKVLERPDGSRSFYIERDGVHWVLADSKDAELFKATQLKLERAHTALKEIKKYNPLHNDLEAYLYDMAEWGMGNLEVRPSPSIFGLME